MPRLAGCLILFLVVGGGDAYATSVTQDCSGTTFLVSSVAVGGLAIFDIATAPASARRYNREHLAIVPVVDPVRRSYGLSVSVPVGPSRRTAAPVVRTQSPPARKSPTGAFFLSFGSTAVPMLGGVAIGNTGGGYVFLGGLVVGPSVGQLYAGRTGRGLATAVLRGVGTVVGISSIIDCFD